MEEDAHMMEEFDEDSLPTVTTHLSTDQISSTTGLPSTSAIVTSLMTEAAKILSSTLPSSTSTSYSTSTESSAATTFSSVADGTSTHPPMTVHVADSEELLFSVVDYGIFVSMLLLSALIGVYFGFLSKVKQDNTKEYLLGGKTMNKFPVSASLIAT